MINVENYVQGQIQKHRRLLDRFSDFQKHMEEGKLTKRRLASMFNAIDCYEDPSSKDNVKRILDIEYLCRAYTDDIPEYLVQYRRIPRSIMFGIDAEYPVDLYTGQWFEFRYNTTIARPEPTPKHMIYYDYMFYNIQMHELAFPVVVVGFEPQSTYSGLVVYVIVRCLGIDGKVAEHSRPLSSLKPISEKKLMMWVYRHKFSLMRKYIRRWVEHIRFKPGSQGYKRSYESFKNNLLSF